MIEVSKNKLVLLLSGWVATLVLGWALDIRSEVSQWRQEEAINQQLNQDIMMNDQLQAQKNELIKNNLKLVDQIKQKLGPGAGMQLPEILLRLFPVAQLSGIRVVAVKPYPIKKIWHKTGRYVEISAVGSLRQFTAFFAEWARTGMPFSFSFLNAYREQDHWRMEMYFIYFINEFGAREDKAQPLSGDLIANVNILQAFPVSQFNYVGMMANAKTQWAVIQLPNERTVSIQLGEKIGSEKARVISVSAQKILLETEAKQLFTIMRAKEKLNGKIN